MTLAQRMKLGTLQKVQNLGTYDKKPAKRVMIEVKKSPKKAEYKVPKTPKVSGLGWGG